MKKLLGADSAEVAPMDLNSLGDVAMDALQNLDMEKMEDSLFASRFSQKRLQTSPNRRKVSQCNRRSC